MGRMRVEWVLELPDPTRRHQAFGGTVNSEGEVDPVRRWPWRLVEEMPVFVDRKADRDGRGHVLAH